MGETKAGLVFPVRIPRAAVPGAALGALLAWAFWPTLWDLARLWSIDPKYSHGYLVPAFAAYLAWRRWRQAPVLLRPNWWGVPVLAVGLGLGLVGSYFYFPWFNQLALLAALAGLAVLLGGWPALRWAWVPIVFLYFMLPLPFRLEGMLAQPLQGLCTQASVYALQTLGFVAYAQGNIILMEGARLGVAEACSGLGMLMTFVALTTAVALLIRRPLLDKLLLVLSAFPIALACNIIRITVTGVLRVRGGQQLAHVVYHDLSGWLMMPLGLAFLWLDLKALRWVLGEAQASGPVAVAVAVPPDPTSHGLAAATGLGRARAEPAGVPK